ncbi:MAG TPA: twin-arginine translocase subunit TatA [Gammaproteobacteria bacterium]|nr:twin-arginine translocase subunit TatA [Gammaproteobacteria bacterium]HCZ47785.1 twin-arginine translocase subunit TatA [Gammaproteobacteria bacterium]MCH77223.1 twin-arginine translocase subunit TatA [Gammaproteobacteria bacterium]
MGGISPFQLLIVLAIVLVLFGGKRLRSLGSDLGGAIKGFRGAMKDGEQESRSDDGGRLGDARGDGDSASTGASQRERHDA